MEVSGLRETSCVMMRVKWEDTCGCALAVVTHSSGPPMRAQNSAARNRIRQSLCVHAHRASLCRLQTLSVLHHHTSKARVPVISLPLWTSRILQTPNAWWYGWWRCWWQWFLRYNYGDETMMSWLWYDGDSHGEDEVMTAMMMVIIKVMMVILHDDEMMVI